MKRTILTLTLGLSISLLLTGCADMVPAPKTDSAKPAQTSSGQTSTTAGDSNKTAEQTGVNSKESTEAGDKSASSSSVDGSKTASVDKNTSASKDTAESTSTSTDKSKTTAASKEAVKISKSQLLSYASMTKADLVKVLGKDYKEQGSTLTFSNGLQFEGLIKDTSKPTFIKCGNNVELMGIKNGMTFDKVQSLLGKSSVIKTYLGTKSNTVYKIQYTYGKDILKVISPKTDGQDSFVELCMQ